MLCNFSVLILRLQSEVSHQELESEKKKYLDLAEAKNFEMKQLEESANERQAELNSKLQDLEQKLQLKEIESADHKKWIHSLQEEILIFKNAIQQVS